MAGKGVSEISSEERREGAGKGETDDASPPYAFPHTTAKVSGVARADNDLPNKRFIMFL